jgi:two-component system, OmpR family, KDP operon response regulator KdpE
MTTPGPHILVIDDEPQILRAMRTILLEKNFRVTTASRGEEGLTLAAANPPDLVILDLGLPDMSGMEVCSRLRAWTQAPIIVLSVRDSEHDKVAALDSGADDYLTKPFGVEELLARVRAVLRRTRPQLAPLSTGALRAGDLLLDPAAHTVTWCDTLLKLTPTEFDLLHYFMQNTGKVITHRELLQRVWGAEYGDEAEYLRVYIRRLRQKIEADPLKPAHLLTEHGLGYRFE